MIGTVIGVLGGLALAGLLFLLLVAGLVWAVNRIERDGWR